MQLKSLVLLEQILRELQREHRGFFGQLAQTFLACIVEQSTATYESLVAVVEQPFLLRCQLAMMQMHLTDTLKQAGIEAHVVGVLCQNGLQLLCQRIHLVVGFSRQQVEEHRRHSGQQIIVSLVLLRIDNRIVEGRLLRIVDGLLDLFIVTTDALHEGFLVVLQTNTVKGHSIVWRIVRFKKRILMLAHTNVNSN